MFIPAQALVADIHHEPRIFQRQSTLMKNLAYMLSLLSIIVERSLLAVVA
jgi:hypothetical protein